MIRYFIKSLGNRYMDNWRIALFVNLPVPEIDKELQQVADMLLATLDMRDNTTGQYWDLHRKT